MPTIDPWVLEKKKMWEEKWVEEYKEWQVKPWAPIKEIGEYNVMEMHEEATGRMTYFIIPLGQREFEFVREELPWDKTNQRLRS